MSFAETSSATQTAYIAAHDSAFGVHTAKTSSSTNGDEGNGNNNATTRQDAVADMQTMDTLVLRSRDSTTMEHWVQCTREACDKLHADLHASAVARKKTEDFLREPWVTARFQSLGVITDEGRRKAVYNDTLNDVKTAGRHDAVWKTVIRTPLDDEATAVMVQ